MDIYIGFDSAWTDNATAPGAICAVAMENGRCVDFCTPRLVSFSQALALIRDIRAKDGVTLIALDQPTIVPNLTSMRPVERVAASLVSWLGGGVQPSNRGRIGMFCDASPVWKFLAALGALERPEEARTAATGTYLMEVFPAMSLASMHDDFYGRLKAPRYNPGRSKTFRQEDWRSVTRVAAEIAEQFNCGELASWCRDAGAQVPRKSDQDRLDAALCVLIALRWRLRPRGESLILGDGESGYMVLPISEAARRYLSPAALRHGVPMDGIVPVA